MSRTSWKLDRVFVETRVNRHDADVEAATHSTDTIFRRSSQPGGFMNRLPSSRTQRTSPPLYQPLVAAATRDIPAAGGHDPRLYRHQPDCATAVLVVYFRVRQLLLLDAMPGNSCSSTRRVQCPR